LHKGRRTNFGVQNLLKIAIKQNSILHPHSIFEEISYHIAFSDGVDTRIHNTFKLPDGGMDVFEDKTKFFFLMTGLTKINHIELSRLSYLCVKFVDGNYVML